jgi:REP element-mobilizing transposase RayT
MIHQPIALEATDEWHNLPAQDFNTQFEMMAAFEVHDGEGVSSGALYTEVSLESEEQPPEAVADELPEPEPEPMSDEDAYVAQLALSLTEVSLELTAEATLLARDGEIVAYAGHMPRQEIDELRGAISDDWNAAPGEVRIRFLTAKGSGKDYMLYSRRTEDDFTLSLIFAGTTPLRDIRRQGKRLVESLLAVPEASAEPRVLPYTQPQTAAAEAPAGEDTSVRSPYTCVWLLRDPHSSLDPAVAQAIIAGLNVQMQEKGWHIQSLQVRDDYVYLFAEVPGDDPAFQIVRDLKRRSAEIAHAQNAAYDPRTLWSDGYLVVTPGRELDAEEIQQFITFERMG